MGNMLDSGFWEQQLFTIDMLSGFSVKPFLKHLGIALTPQASLSMVRVKVCLEEHVNKTLEQCLMDTWGW